MKDELKIGLALGGGGAKAIAHVGVLKVFEKYGIRPCCVAGTSAGAIVGAAHSLGQSADEIFKRLAPFGQKRFSPFKNFNLFSESLIKDKMINASIQNVLEDKTFDDLKIPFIATAVDLENGEEIVLNKGPLWKAARASSAIPFIFSPVFLDNRYLVDGGLLNNVPVDHIREYGAVDIIIGVELGGMTSRQFISGMVWEKYYKKPRTFELYPSFITRWKTNTNLMTHILLRAIDIMREVSQKYRYEKAKPDIFIKPNVEAISLLDFDKYEEGMEIGINAAEKAMPEILKVIKQKEEEKRNQMVKSAVEKTPEV